MFRKPQPEPRSWEQFTVPVQTVAERAIEARQHSLDRCQIRRDELLLQKNEIESEVAELNLEIEALESASKVYERFDNAVVSLGLDDMKGLEDDTDWQKEPG